MGGIENLGECRWWGNWEIFGGWGSWVKYGGNMEGVGKCIGLWACGGGKGRCVGGVGSVLGCAKVWGGVGNGGRCVEVCLGCGEMCLGCGERCRKGVGEGAMWGVRGSVGRNMGQSGRAGKYGEKVSVTNLDPNLPEPNPPHHNSPIPNFPDPPNPTPPPPRLQPTRPQLH